MKLFRKEMVALLTCCLGLISSAHATESTNATFTPETDFVAQTKKGAQQNSHHATKNRSMIHVGNMNDFQAKQSVFTQMNIGIGFLYFDGISGNIALQPTANNTPNPFGAATVESLYYNRTPIFEYVLGYRMFNWLKYGLSFQNQSGTVVTTNFIPVKGGNSSGFAHTRTKLTSYLELNSLMLKVLFELPRPLVVKTAAFVPYLGVGVGPTWQSWTDILVAANYIETGSGSFYQVDSIRQKIIANCGLLVDAGFRMRSIFPQRQASWVFGCKFNLWGQVRDLGKDTQQAVGAYSLIKPLRVKTLYSFAPYMGLQWNFMCNTSKDQAQRANSKPAFWSNPTKGQKVNQMFTQMNVGVGFLYFDDVSNNIFGLNLPSAISSGVAPMKGSLRYNRTPLYEFVLGFQPLSFMKYGLSLQTQQNVYVSTKVLDAFNFTTTNGEYMQQQFSSHLGLYSVMAKIYFQLPYYANIYKSLMAAPYIAGGVGPAWQSWTKNTLFATNVSNNTSHGLILRQKNPVNCGWMIDAGLHMRGKNVYSPFTMSLGCKFNSYGQATNIGDLTQTRAMKWALWKPFNIRMVYSFAPYAAMQWQFPLNYKYCLDNKQINRWKPFYTFSGNLQKRQGFFTQSTIGVGFLYFSDVSGELTVTPIDTFSNYRQLGVEGRLQYNRTPLYDFVIGYQALNWLRYGLSYQYQGSVFLQTPMTRAFGTANNSATWGQLRSQWSVNAIMAKVYFEVPYAFVMKGWASMPYLGVGVGPAWQSVTDPQFNVQSDFGGSGWINPGLGIRAKYSANCAFVVDAGIRVKNATDQCNLSITTGCKYNEWGQIRSVGKLSQQGASKQAFFKPFRVKTVYSFAPYIGVQWNF